MSITAQILLQTVTHRDHLAAVHGAHAVDNSLFITAARIIAGEYQN
jgi:hypothetical protein